MLNLAGFGPDEHQLFIQAGLEGLRDLLDDRPRHLPRQAGPGRDRAQPASRLPT